MPEEGQLEENQKTVPVLTCQWWGWQRGWQRGWGWHSTGGTWASSWKQQQGFAGGAGKQEFDGSALSCSSVLHPSLFVSSSLL